MKIRKIPPLWTLYSNSSLIWFEYGSPTFKNNETRLRHTKRKENYWIILSFSFYFVNLNFFYYNLVQLKSRCLWNFFDLLLRKICFSLIIIIIIEFIAQIMIHTEFRKETWIEKKAKEIKYFEKFWEEKFW